MPETTLADNLLASASLVCAIMIVITLFRFRGPASYSMPLAFLFMGSLLLAIRFRMGSVAYSIAGTLLAAALILDFVYRHKHPRGGRK